MEKLVEDFKKFVNDSWRDPLNKNTCIPIHIRKIIKNLLREYIIKAPPLKEEHKQTGRPLNLFMTEYVEQNPVYVALFKNNVLLHESAVSMKKFVDVNTLGKFLLFVVYRIMAGATDAGNIMDGRNPNNTKDVDTQMDYFCYLFLWYMGSASVYYDNKSLVFGIPMYWWRGEGLHKNVYMKLDEYFNTYDPNHKINGAVSFARYLADTYDKIGDDKKNMPHINISFNAFNTNFISSVPEIILDGLCYTVYDKIKKHGKAFYLDVFLKPTKYNGFTFKTLDHTKEGIINGITKDDVMYDDRGAIRFSYHPSFNKRVEYYPRGPIRRHPDSQEDTLSKQHEVDGKFTNFTRNHSNNGYYLVYKHYNQPEEYINNEFERRDRLTYDETVCTKYRFDQDIDDDKTTYYRMLRDRFIGLLDVKPPLSEVEVVGEDEDEEENENHLCMDIDKLDKLLSPLESYIRDKPCCYGKSKGITSSTNTFNNSYPIVRETYRPTLTRSNLNYIFNRHRPYNLDNWWYRQRHGAIW